jgi:hypothetical protein
MPPLKQRPHLVRLTAAVLIATVLHGCTSWHVRPLPLQPAHFSRSVHPGKVRLTLADGSRVTVPSPVIRGDSMFGNSPPVALALTSIRWAEVLQTDDGKSILLMAGLGLTALIIYAVTSFDEISFF